MAERVSIKEKRKDAPAWAFVWKSLGRPLSAHLLPIMLVGSLFALALIALRIQVTPPKPWSARKGSLICAVDNAEGRALAMRAREGGPFPSRFDLREWSGTAALEEALLDRTMHGSAPYVPKLRNLEGNPLAGELALFTPGVPFLPKHEPEGVAAERPVKNSYLVPVLRGLTGIRAADMPVDLPPFDGASAVKLSSRDWRFLIRLDSSKHVDECVSLSGEDDAVLVNWLQGVSFQAKSIKTPRWIAVEVGFINQETNGTGNL